MDLFNLENMSKTAAAHLASVKVDSETTRKAYKTAKKVWVAKYCSEAKFVNLHVYFAEYMMAMTDEVEKSERLLAPFMNSEGVVTKPVITKTMDAQQRALAYVPYNEYKSLEDYRKAYLVADIVTTRFNMKMYKKLVDKLVDSFLTSLKTKYKGDFIINTLNDTIAFMFGFEDPMLGGQLIDMIVESGMITRRKMGTVSNSKHKQFMLSTSFDEIEELFAIKAMTDRHSVRMAKPALIDKDSFIISQNTWRYEQQENSPALVQAINKLNGVPLAFAEWVTEADVEDAVREKLDSDDVWVELEIALVLNEFRRIKSNGNKFFIEHFVDGANRIYEYKAHFGVQEGSTLRKMIRFYNKKAVTPKGVKAYLNSIQAEYGHTNLEVLIEEFDDEWGWFDAVLNPTEPTGSIVYRDATNQVVGIYGLLTGDEVLMALGGFVDMEESQFVKAYKLYADGMNTALGVFYTRQIGVPVYTDAFTNDNVKSAVMTSLYNVSLERILTGKGYNPESEDDEDTIVPEIDSEFETSKSKLGKLVPLLKSAREFEARFETEVYITKEQLGEIHKKVIGSILFSALRTMRQINAVIKGCKDLTLMKWEHMDGTINQYAMVENKVVHVPWISTRGHRHSFKHHIKVLSAGVKWRGGAPRYIQSDDSGFIRGGAINADIKGYDIVGIHDSEGTHGNDIDDTTEQYIEDCVTLAKSDHLTTTLSLLSGLNLKSLHSGRDMDEIVAQIRTAKLAFIA